MLKRLALVSLVAAVVLSSRNALSAGEMVVIVNKALPADSLSREEVKAHFLKKPGVWGNGVKVQPVDQAVQGPERVAFLSKVLGMTSSDLERHWISEQYATAENPPPRVQDDASVIKMVESWRGGIGFVNRSALTDVANVKAVLTVSY